MITTNIFSMNSSHLNSHKHNEASSLPVIELNKSMDDVEKELDETFPFTSSNGVFEVLQTVSAHQKKIVAQMVSQNPEYAITHALAAGIDAYGKQLEIIQGWTNGGVKMFESALWLMLEGIKEGGIQPDKLEDLFQIALLEIMTHSEKYGLENWYEVNKEDISHILESIGSASHGYHEQDYNSAEKLANITKNLYDEIKTNATIPPGSLLDQVMTDLEGAGGSDALHTQINDHYHDDYGWWVNNIGEPATELSPMLRLFILSEVLEENPQMKQEDVELILMGSVSELDAYIAKIFGNDSSGNQYTTLIWFCEKSNWQIQEGDSDKGGHGGQIDWLGNGININDLVDLYSNFPPRELTDEELKEVNRIGDQVKMLQQTLKYWLQICRDEQLAIVRNI